MRRVQVSLVFVLVAAGGCAAPADAPPDVQARRIEGQVWSPYCPGRLLADCTTQQADELRTEIETRLERGGSPDEVRSWLRTNYGDEVLAAPEASGFGLAVWLVPLALVGTGAVVVLVLVRRWARAPRPEADTSPVPDPQAVARVREDVERDL